MSYIYSLIALEPDIVLSEHTDYQGNFLQIMRVILKKLINQNDKRIKIHYDNSYDVYLLNDGMLTFLTLTEGGMNDKEAFALLYDMKAQLYNMMSYDKVIKLTAYQLNFNDSIRNLMIYYKAHPINAKTGESIDALDLSKDAIEDTISSIIEKESIMSLIVMKELNRSNALTGTANEIQREVFNIEMAVNEIKSEDNNNKRSKGYLALAGGITAFLMLFYYII